MTHHEHVESIGAYALGALPEFEARAFERHLMGCEDCQEELQRLQEAADALPRAVTPYEAPPSLKRSLMDVVNAEAKQPARVPAPRERRAWLPRLSMRPAMAFAAAAAAVAALAFTAGTQLDGEEDGSRTIAAEVDERRLPQGRASLLIPDRDESGALLRVEGMPSPGTGRVYQVWVQRGDEVEPVSIFDVDSQGRGSAAIPESLDGVSAVMVTREKRGGVAVPTEVPVLRAAV